MQVYHDAIIRTNGSAVSGASVEVRTFPGGVLASIFEENGGAALPNPLTSDSNGRFQFAADDGRYSLIISGIGITTFTLIVPSVLVLRGGV